ncbi:MAG: DNA translocase FtsK [Bacteroidales bacterium]|nr:DNA translocase FtsK [Bacteroidales bacterium]
MRLPKLRFWNSWDDRQKANAVKWTGAVIALFALFTLLAMVSYIFTWKQDQSLLRDPGMMDQAVGVANLGGKLGLKWANTLMVKWFGLGSFAFLILLFAMAARLLAGRWHRSLLKTAAVTLSGALIAALACAYVGRLVGVQTLFGAGPGGECGAHVTGWFWNLLGPAVTGVLLALLVIGWLILCSERFSKWFGSLGAPSDGEEPEEKPVREFKPVFPLRRKAEAETPAEPEPAPEPASQPAPVLQPVRRPAKPVKPEASETPEAAEGISEIDRGEDLVTEVTEQLPRIDVRLDPPEGLPSYKFPSLDLLEDHASGTQIVSDEELNRNNNKIRSTLKNYKIDIMDVKAVVGPTVTLYKVYPAPGVKIANIRSLQDDIAMSLNARGVRIVTLPDSVGIEVANDKPSIVPIKGLLNDEAFRTSKADLPVAIGCTITKKVKVFDLADAPHLLVAGATKQGKSVGLNVLIASLLYSKHPAEMKLVFIDPKMVEFSAYGRLLKHYLAVLPTAADEEEEADSAIVKKPKEAEKILRSLCTEMDERYELLSKAFVNNIKLYNERYKDRKLNPEHGHRFLPYLVVIIDEYADLAMSGGSGSEAKNMQKSIMGSIVRLAQKGRAAGIHVVIATQRPSVDVITGLIKANFPARIAFRVSTRVDSNTILDATGAEKLIGRGDMLYYAGVETERIQCGYISNDEINAITEFIGDQQGYKKSYNTPYYLPSPEPAEGEAGGGMIDMKDLDERFEEAARMVVMTQRGSTSDLQRKLGMGYAKAGRVMDQLEAAGIVGPQEGSKPRQVLVTTFDELDAILKAFMK